MTQMPLCKQWVVRLLVALVLFWPAPLQAAALDTDEAAALFSSANAHYRSADYDGAIEGYLSLADAGFGNKAVFFNLGNAYLQADRLAHALWAYRHAERLAPRDPDVRANLEHVRRRLELSARRVPWWRKLLLFDGYLSVDELALFFSVTLWAACLFGLAVGWRSGVGWKRAAGFCAGLAFWLCGALLYQTHNVLRNGAVVTDKARPVYFAPSEEAEVRFKLPLGAEVLILDSKYKWVQIRSEDGVGWVESDFLLPFRSLSGGRI